MNIFFGEARSASERPLRPMMMQIVKLRKDARAVMASLEGEGARKAIPDVDAE